MVTCPCCDGETNIVFHGWFEGCFYCNATGKVTQEMEKEWRVEYITVM